MNTPPRYRWTKRPTSLAQSIARSIALTVCLLLPVACKKAAPEDDKPVISVQAEHPVEGPITEEIVADATLAPIAQAAIQSKITAPIKAFYVQRGSHVKAGQLLATLENQDLAAAALDNQGVYTAAQGAYATATKQQVPQEETQARLDLDQAKATLALDQNILNARSQLLTQGAIPGRDVDTAKATVLQAQAAYQIAKQKFDSITSTGKAASLQAAEGQLTSAKGKYLGAEAQLAYTGIRTPIAGVVTDRPLFAGETAPAGTAVVTVMETSTLIAKLHLAQRQAQQLALGAEATLTVPGIDDPVKAKVSLISPALDPGSTTVEVWLKVDNREGQLKAGTSVHATIKGKTIDKALLVPTDSVQRSSDSGGKVVMVIAPDGTAHKKNITVGIQTAETAQVLEGLTPADAVITTGGYGLDEGARVKVEAASTKPTDKPAAGEKE